MFSGFSFPAIGEITKRGKRKREGKKLSSSRDE